MLYSSVIEEKKRKKIISYAPMGDSDGMERKRIQWIQIQLNNM